jgi:hypothetical protein
MELLDLSILVWDPALDIKIDPKQATFIIPEILMPAARCVLYQRYHVAMNKLDGYNVTWVDETDEPLRPINIPSQFNDIDNIQKNLPFSLFKTFIQVYYGC